ncbi:MAG: AAA family ATPase [Planctomycetes bacterium]|nr:AAA family ATPase [Planctomycetota bacterium]
MELSRITWQIAPNLDLAPSRANLATLEPRLGTDDGADVLLRNLLESNSGRYDYCVVDCPPHLGLLMRNGLRAADEVIIPIDTGFFALQGLTQQLLTIDQLEGPAQAKPSVRILPNQYDVRTKLARETLAEVRKRFEGLVCQTVLNFNTKLREGVSFGQPITEFAPTSMGARDFQKLAREVMAGQRPGKLTSDILAHAERLAADADRLLATTTVLVGNAAPVGDATPSPVLEVDSDVAPPPVLVTGAKPSAEPVEAALQPFTPPEISVGLVRKTPSREPAVRIQPVESMEATLSVTSSADRSGSKSIIEIDPAPVAESPLRDQEKKPQPAQEAAPTPTPAPAVVARQAGPAAPVATHEQIDRKIEQIYGVRQEGETVIFRSRHPDASEIQLAGDFNDWMPHTTPMRKLTNGDFECRLRLPKGRYRYRLVVDGRWLHDVHNPVIETNEYGELNSVVEITR